VIARIFDKHSFVLKANHGDQLKADFQKLQLEHENLKQRLSAPEADPVTNGVSAKESEDEVNPWDVKAGSDKGVDYEKLIIR
jgi:hypothetical protein